LVILERCKDSAQRQFYLERTKQFGWTKNVLIHQIENKTYEKTLLNQTNFDTALPEQIRNQAKLAVKDEYTFDFLELADEHSERQLEQAILAKVEPFLLEMGGMFSFVGSQYRLRSYASTRKRLGCDNLSQTFFVSESGAPLAYSTVGVTFLNIVRRLGIHGMARSDGPNLRCLRHTFAVRRLLNWYSQGMDVNKLLPQLSVYLGHAKPQNTYWYLTATPELLRKAGSRFESYAGQRAEL
jgi:predicted nuclease of restriction endonuclease-like (RecB) superfamily